ncbi:hypothetical protein AB0G60_00510 [Streptomyces angustmyceticus]|uniref:Peptidase M15A C-terminal domain-containing protein n=1 Tax=Streptomyces angustmyceticus TaxID=285578 RepID=A0A5J4L2J7_9ACTN|nr:hypothetical protein [Streptomyces angustmyceticus]UAL65194.1 hypothetical protein K7396_00530 [Streptomyces angustmyceticus]GES28353.1 hypothetical protein San01_08400 [Streptomyces angustmyceticus]
MSTHLSARSGAVAVLAAVALAAPVVAADTAAARGTKLTHAQAASKLRAAGISWTSSGHCSNRNNRSCTSFTRINSGTVSGIITFKRASRCAVTITGGTETGHASGQFSHWNGYKVDISPTGCVTNYIKHTFRYAGKRGDGAPMYKSSTGNIYARESSHWDITYK